MQAVESAIKQVTEDMPRISCQDGSILRNHQEGYAHTDGRKITRSPAVIGSHQTPLSHIAAGMALPSGGGVYRVSGDKESNFNKVFADDVPAYAGFLSRAVELEWIDAEDVAQVITLHEVGSEAQASACVALVNNILTDVEKRATESSGFSGDQYCSANSWAYSFSILKNSIIDELKEMDFPDDDLCPGIKLSLTLAGVCTYGFDFSELSSFVRSAVIELLGYCSQISCHALVSELLTSEAHLWLIHGELGEILSNLEYDELADLLTMKDEQLIKRMSDLEYSDELDCQGIKETIESIIAALDTVKYVKCISRANVQCLVEALDSNDESPGWLIDLTKTLANYCNFQVAEKNSFSDFGSIPPSFLRPISIGIDGEEDVMEQIHFHSMNDSSASVLSVAINSETVDVLANIILGEKIISLLDESLLREIEKRSM